MREAAEKAFRLAYFIHTDRVPARRITAQALARLGASFGAQRKRFYYLPLRKARTKVSPGELQILQWLVLRESEVVEREQEQAATFNTLPDKAWLVRFVKHLVAITSMRSSFYVALGLSRLLYNYSTTETLCIYDAVRQDADRPKDEPYSRKQKAILMRQLKERFGAVLRTRRVSHGEERFIAREDPSRCAALIRLCLNMFTPWGTTCVIPERFDPVNDFIDPLRFDGEEPDREHPVEVRRIHALLHHDCYQRLVTALGFELPAQRLTVPIFFGAVDDEGAPTAGGNPGDDGGPPPGLSDDEFAEISDSVKAQTARRRKAAPHSLSIMIDGAERATLRLDDPHPVRLPVGGEAMLVEVRGCDAQGEILLANFLLQHGELRHAQPSKKYSFKLAGGRKLFLSISPHIDREGEIEELDLEFAYRHAGPLGVFVRFRRRIGERVRFAAFKRPTPAFGAVGLTILIVAGLLLGLALFRRSQLKTQPDSEYVAQVVQTLTPALPPHNSGVNSALEGPRLEKNQDSVPTRKPKAREPSVPPASANAAGRGGRYREGTRDSGPASAGELLAVRVIYVEEHANGVDAGLRESLIKGVVAGRRLEISDDPQQADAFLLWSLRRTPASRVIEARLMNRRRQKLWNDSQLISGVTSDPDVEAQAAAKLAQKLLDEISRNKRPAR